MLVAAFVFFGQHALFSQALVDNPCTTPYPAGAEITVNNPCTNVSTAGMSALFSPGTCGSGGFDDGWAWFQGDGNQTTVSYTGTTGDPILHVFEVTTAPCGITQMGCSDNTGTGGNESVGPFATNAGTTYLIRIQNWFSNATTTGCLEVASITPVGDYFQATTGINGEKVGACLVTDCGPFVFTDDGGTTANYSNNIDAGGGYTPVNAVYRVFCPNTAGNCMQATFTEFVTANNLDVMFVRNGPTEMSPPFTGAPMQTTLWPSPPNPAIIGSALYGDLTASTPFTFTSTDASGCLTFAFLSSAVNTAAGWSATLQCVPCAGGPTGTDNNDCQTLTALCSGASISGNSTGPGINAEGCTGNACPAGGENHSDWYSFQAFSTGTLEITITPTTGTDDYDFAIYGPNPTCASLGSPIRCSDSGLSGTTGLTAAATDHTEDAAGDSFLQTMNVVAGQQFILVVDEWSANAGSGYTLSFGGTASLDCSILPVELTEFNVEYAPDLDIADVTWTTETERDCDYFVIEHSTNGTDFFDVAQIQGQGNTTSETQYYFGHKDPAVGINYYRLRQVDFNGDTDYSEIKTINILDEAYDMISAYPNPTTGKTDVIFNCYSKEESTLKLYNPQGKLIESKVLNCTPGGNRVSLDLSNERSGIYFVAISTNDKVYTTQIVKN